MSPSPGATDSTSSCMASAAVSIWDPPVSLFCRGPQGAEHPPRGEATALTCLDGGRTIAESPDSGRFIPAWRCARRIGSGARTPSTTGSSHRTIRGADPISSQIGNLDVPSRWGYTVPCSDPVRMAMRPRSSALVVAVSSLPAERESAPGPARGRVSRRRARARRRTLRVS